MAEPVEPLVIEEIWAWLSSDADGEGVLAAPVPGLGNVPLIGADAERMQSYEPIALQIADMFQVSVSLVRFSTRELILTMKPTPKSTKGDDD